MFADAVVGHSEAIDSNHPLVPSSLSWARQTSPPPKSTLRNSISFEEASHYTFQNQTPLYKEIGTSAGNLGVIRPDGGFDFLLDVRLPAHHQINQYYGVPDDFETIGDYGHEREIVDIFPPNRPILSKAQGRRVWEPAHIFCEFDLVDL